MAFTRSIDELIKNDKTGLLGKHPSWKRVKLSLIASILNGAPFESSKFSSSEGTPLIRIRDLLTGSTETFYTGEYQDTYLINKGDLLVGMDGDFNSCLWNGATGLLNQRVCKVTIETELYDKTFVNLLLPGYLTSINEHTSSVTVKHLSSKTIGDIDLPLPPRKEQTRIVEKLEELLPQLDAGMAELQAAQKKLKQYRQSLLKAAVEGQLTADWRKRNVFTEDGAQLLERILSERRSHWEAKQLAKFNSQGKKPPKGWQDKYPEPARPDTANLPELPDGWVWATIEEVGNIQLGRQRSTSKIKGLSPTKYIRAANITENGVDLSDVLHMDFNEEERETFYLQQGDILLTEASGSPEHVGRPAIWKGPERMYCFQNTVLRFSPKGITSTFSYFSFMSMQKLGIFRKLSTGVGINHLSAGKFSRLPIAIPGIQEQETIVSLLDQELEYCNKLEREIDVSLSKIALQRQNILRAAFAGELVPQDPNDEPASELLARIAAERAAKQVSKRAPAEGNKPTAVEPSGTKRRKRKEAS